MRTKTITIPTNFKEYTESAMNVYSFSLPTFPHLLFIKSEDVERLKLKPGMKIKARYTPSIRLFDRIEIIL